jgi:hypothetical protein
MVLPVVIEPMVYPPAIARGRLPRRRRRPGSVQRENNGKHDLRWPGSGTVSTDRRPQVRWLFDRDNTIDDVHRIARELASTKI